MEVSSGKQLSWLDEPCGIDSSFQHSKEEENFTDFSSSVGVERTGSFIVSQSIWY